jgi:hypothetical protein
MLRVRENTGCMPAVQRALGFHNAQGVHVFDCGKRFGELNQSIRNSAFSRSISGNGIYRNDVRTHQRFPFFLAAATSFSRLLMARLH